MAGAGVDDWYALLTERTGDIQRSRKISARLVALDEPEILSGVASRMISENAGSHWYIEPICDRLPAASLRQLEDWVIPATPVELVQADERWRQQDWALSNDRENLHRAGGEPTWIQAAGYPACPGCTRTMSAAGQIAVGDLWNAEGICYLLWCDSCAISAVVYQQT